MLLKQAQAQAQLQAQAQAQAQTQAMSPVTSASATNQDSSANATPDAGQAIAGQDKDTKTIMAESQADATASATLDAAAQPTATALSTQVQGVADGLGQDASTVNTSGVARVAGAVADPNVPKQASGSEAPAVSGALVANAQGPPTSSTGNIPESTLGFAQAMLAVPVPVITLPPTLPHGHGTHGQSDASKTSAHPPAAGKALPAPVKEELTVKDEPPMVVAYHPITRVVDTYGGIDILVMEKFHIPHFVPGREYLGMSLSILDSRLLRHSIISLLIRLCIFVHFFIYSCRRGRHSRVEHVTEVRNETGGDERVEHAFDADETRLG